MSHIHLLQYYLSPRGRRINKCLHLQTLQSPPRHQTTLQASAGKLSQEYNAQVFLIEDNNDKMWI